jgi:hypothetical protein
MPKRSEKINNAKKKSLSARTTQRRVLFQLSKNFCVWNMPAYSIICRLPMPIPIAIAIVIFNMIQASSLFACERLATALLTSAFKFPITNPEFHNSDSDSDSDSDSGFGFRFTCANFHSAMSALKFLLLLMLAFSFLSSVASTDPPSPMCGEDICDISTDCLKKVCVNNACMSTFTPKYTSCQSDAACPGQTLPNAIKDPPPTHVCDGNGACQCFAKVNHNRETTQTSNLPTQLTPTTTTFPPSKSTRPSFEPPTSDPSVNVTTTTITTESQTDPPTTNPSTTPSSLSSSLSTLTSSSTPLSTLASSSTSSPASSSRGRPLQLTTESLGTAPASVSMSSSSPSSTSPPQSSLASKSSDGITQPPPDTLSVAAIAGIAVAAAVALCLLVALVAFAIRRFGKTPTNTDRDVELTLPMTTSAPAHSEYAKVQVSPMTNDYTRPHGNYAGAPPQLYDVAPANLDHLYDSPPPQLMPSGSQYGDSSRRESGYDAPLPMGSQGHYDSVHDKLV